LSFRQVKDEVREEFLNLFKDEYSLSSALYAYEDQLHINIVDKQALLQIKQAIWIMIMFIIFLVNIIRIHLAAIMIKKCLNI